jgi:hypothetical protein
MVAEIIADKLEDAGVGTVGTNIFIGTLPDENNNCLAVIDTGGMESDHDVPIAEFTFQVLIRNSVYSDGRDLIDDVYNALNQVANVTLDSTYVYTIIAVNPGAHIGRDDAGRDMFSINFKCKAIYGDD